MATRSKKVAFLNTAETWDLAENDAVRLPGGRYPLVIHVQRGTVLVTQEGDRDDHVVEAGGTLVVPVGGLAVAWAFTDATISVSKVFVTADALRMAEPTRAAGRRELARAAS